MISSCESPNPITHAPLASRPCRAFLRGTFAGRGMRLLPAKMNPYPPIEIEIVKKCKCGKPRRLSGHDCLECLAERQAIFRIRHKPCVAMMTDAEREKKKARSKLNHGIKAGKIKRLPCEHIMTDGERCNLETVQAHHEDYSKPYDVKWLCIIHHKIADLKKLHAP